MERGAEEATAGDEEEQRGREEATSEHALENIRIPAPPSLLPGRPRARAVLLASPPPDETERGHNDTTHER